MQNCNKQIDGILAGLLRHLAANQAVADVSRQFSMLATNAQRVDFVYRLLDEYGLFPSFVPDVKNNESAAEMRRKGNEMFKLRKNGEAVEFYTHSVALAEDGSEHLALAYANRSAVLCENGFYAECLMDIDRALEQAYPENLKPKLLARQQKAIELKPNQVPNHYFTPIPEIPENQKNKLIQNAANSIEIKCSESQGRHVVAARDIAVGEVIVVEKPFCSILVDHYFSHCHECLKLCYNLIPCPGCTQTLYCSVDCRNVATVYHKYECKILALVKQMGMEKLMLLPLKISLLVKERYSFIFGVDDAEDDIYRSDRYKEIHNLVSNTASRSVSDLFERSCGSAVLFYLVKRFTDFFHTEEEEEVFKELVLLHTQTSVCNFHEISELAQNDEGVYEPCEVGAGAYSFLSMFNHRCSPNVLRNCYGSEIVIRALENIKKGEQCYDNYGYHHALTPRADRKAKLKKQYFFDCTCDVCQEDWPLYANLPEMESEEEFDETDILRLQEGDVETAKAVLDKILPKMKEQELVKPNKNFAEMQEIAKQCFAALGNVRKSL